MARIFGTERQGVRLVTVLGPLEAGDLRRLEGACGWALEHRVPPLVIDLDSRTADASARAYLERLKVRGVTIRHPAGDQPG